MMNETFSFVSAFGKAYESIDKVGYDLFYRDPRKIGVKLFKNKQPKNKK